MIISWQSGGKVTSEGSCRTKKWNIAVKYYNGTEDLHQNLAGKSKGTTKFKNNCFVNQFGFSGKSH